MITRPRKRRKYRRNFFLGNLYLNVGAQYTTTIIVAVLFAGLVFTGLLLFRYVDHDDLLTRGRQFLREGKVAKAAQTFEFLVDKYPDSYDGHVALGNAYLNLDDRRKAEHEFQVASSLRGSDLRKNAADIAQSKLLIAQHRYEAAYQLLLDLYSPKSKDMELKQAIMDVLEHWGDSLSTNTTDLLQAADKYLTALNFVTDFETESRIKEKLTTAIGGYSELLIKDKQFAKAAKLLERSLKYKYDAQNLVRVAEMYERQGKTEKAIVWYRKAFDINPEIISLKLSNMLIQKGKTLAANNQPEQAERYFNEADNVLRQTNIPADQLYPVELTQFKIAPGLNIATGTLSPQVSVAVQNRSHRPLDFMKVKVMFYSGDELLAEEEQTPITIDHPLTREGDVDSKFELSFEPEKGINVHKMKTNTLQVKVGVAYSESENQQWFIKGIQDIQIKNRNTPARTPEHATGEPA